MYLDQKVSVWQRVHFNSEEDMNQAIEKLKSGEWNDINDVCNEQCVSSENLLETETILTPEGNEDYSTIEIFKSESELVYQNGNQN